jgi:polysaccharide export outer membrane protein
VIDIQKLLVGGDLSLDVPLRNGDKIYVPGTSTAGQIYIFGEVKNPGYYVYKPNMTIFEAIHLAGGFSEYAKMSGIKIKRKTGENGEKVEIKANLKALLKSGELTANIYVQPGDIIIVPSTFLF